MAAPEDELQVLREKNIELVQKVQHWKMLAAQRDNEKLELMKELNEMRLTLARLRNNGNLQASKLDTAIQSTSEKALAHLVRASGEIARTIDLAKAYMKERKEVDTVSSRWSAIGGTPKTEKIHRVPPMMIGGQFIQPIVSLNRTLLNTSIPRPAARSPNQNRNVTERAVPMHMLQDVYIPLTRIDARDLQTNSMEIEAEANSDDSAEELGLDDSGDRSNILEESQHISDEENYNSSRRLNAVSEDFEPDEVETPPRISTLDNPLEGPSWLLDLPRTNNKACVSQSRRNLEPDSTTEVEEVAHTTPSSGNRHEGDEDMRACTPRTPCVFSPTVRRRKRTSSPPVATPSRLSPYSPRPAHNRRLSNSGRVLKVMVAKMRLDSISPVAKRVATESSLGLLDAPSPNGATVAGVIVSESTQNGLDVEASGDHVTRHRDRQPSHDSFEALSQNTQDSRAINESGHDSRVKEEHDSCTMNESEQDSRVKQERSSRDNRSRHRDLSSRHSSHDSDSGSSADPLSVACLRRPRNKVSYREKPLSSSRHGSHDSDSGSSADPLSDGRSRRPRNKVSYQEKPLNRKMRR